MENIKELFNEIESSIDGTETQKGVFTKAYLPEFVKLSTHVRDEGIVLYDELKDELVYEGDDSKAAFKELDNRGLVWQKFQAKENTIEKAYFIHDNIFLTEKQANSNYDGKDIAREGYIILKEGETLEVGWSAEHYRFDSYEAALEELNEELEIEQELNEEGDEKSLYALKSEESEINVSEKELLAKSLSNFKDAHRDLVENWGNMNELDSVLDYPFEKSFDEYNVDDWVDNSVEEINENSLKQEKANEKSVEKKRKLDVER